MGVSEGAEGPPFAGGSLAERLTAGDKGQIVGLSATVAGEAWLIKVYPMRPEPTDTWVADVYLAADRATTRLRRGRVLTCRSNPPQPPQSHRRWWLDEEQGAYAQVSLEGSRFGPDLVEPGTPEEQPFMVSGHWTDDEILGVVGFIRSSPTDLHFFPRGPEMGGVPPSSGGIDGWRPIVALSRTSKALFQVSIEISEVDGQLVQLRREGAKWIIIDVRYWRI
jgi:hypothetical protein